MRIVRSRKIHPQFKDNFAKCKFISVKHIFKGGYAANERYTPFHGFYGWKFVFDDEDNSFKKKLDTNYVVSVQNDGYGMVPDVLIPLETSKDGKFWYPDPRDPQKDKPNKKVPIEAVKDFLSKDSKSIYFNRYKLDMLTKPQTRKVKLEALHPISGYTIKDSQGFATIEEKEVTVDPVWEMTDEVRSADPLTPDFDALYPCFRIFFTKNNFREGSSAVNSEFLAPSAPAPVEAS